MEVNRLDSATLAIQQQQSNEDYAKKRVQLFSTSSFQTGGGFQQDFSALTSSNSVDSKIDAVQSNSQTVLLNDGTEVDIPAQQSETRAESNRIYGAMSSADAAATRASASKLASAALDVAGAERVAAAGDPQGTAKVDIANDALRSAFAQTVELVVSGMRSVSGSQTSVSGLTSTSGAATAYESPTPTNLNLTTEEFSNGMTEAMTVGMSAVEDNIYDLLQSFSDKQEMSNEVSTDATELQEMLADWEDGTSQSFTWHEESTDEDGNTVLVEKTDTLTKEEAESLLTELQSSAEGLGAISTVDGYKLQVAVQDYQQAMTTLSNVMKNYDEDLKSIINNIK